MTFQCSATQPLNFRRFFWLILQQSRLRPQRKVWKPLGRADELQLWTAFSTCRLSMEGSHRIHKSAKKRCRVPGTGSSASGSELKECSMQISFLPVSPCVAACVRACLLACIACVCKCALWQESYREFRTACFSGCRCRTCRRKEGGKSSDCLGFSTSWTPKQMEFRWSNTHRHTQV